jgi:hypothetical protein
MFFCVFLFPPQKKMLATNLIMRRRVAGAMALAQACSDQPDLLASGSDRKGIRRTITQRYRALVDSPAFADLKDAPEPKDLADFCFKWGDQLISTNTLDDQPRSGRPTKVSDQQCKEAYTAIIEAKRRGELAPTQAAVNKIPRVEEIREAAGAHPRTMMRRLRAATPLKKNVRVDFKKPLATATVDARLDQAEAWLKAGVQASGRGIKRIPAPSGDGTIPIPPKPKSDGHGRCFLKAAITASWAEGAVKRLFSVVLPAVLEAKGHYPEKIAR